MANSTQPANIAIALIYQTVLQAPPGEDFDGSDGTVDLIYKGLIRIDGERQQRLGSTCMEDWWAFHQYSHLKAAQSHPISALA